MKRLFLTLLIMVLLGAPLSAWGQGGDTPDAAGQAATDEGAAGVQSEVYGDMAELPPVEYLLEPEISAWLGARVVSVDGANRALEYGWPHSSVAGGFRLNINPLPHRLDAELDWLNKNDYVAELSYAYKDIVKFSYLGLGLWHNLDHFHPLVSTPARLIEKNPGWDYHVEVKDNRLALRLKWPEEPYHAFAEFRMFEKDGTVQQRFFGRQTLVDATDRKFSEERDIDWITRQYRAGINGNLGPVELEYAHRIKTFDPQRTVALKDFFNSGAGGGTYLAVHSVVPQLETQEDSVKVHTSYTGRVVGSATFVNGSKENHTSGASAEYRRGYADLTLIPLKDLTVAVRYRFKQTDTDNPSSVFDPTFLPVASRMRATKDSIDSTVNRAEVSVRYSPINAFSVKAEYDFVNTYRTNAKLWSQYLQNSVVIPYDQNEHIVKLGVNTRPFRSLSAKGSLEYTYTADPAYPTKPVNSFKGRFDTDWTPTESLSAGAYYRFFRGKNNTVHMDSSRDNIGALVTWSPLPRFSVYANYDYTRVKSESDVDFSFAVAPLTVEDHVPYQDNSHLYSLGMGYTFAVPLSVNTEFHQSWSSGRFRTSVVGGGAISTSYISPLINMNIRETGGSVKVGYDFPKGWGASVSYTVNDYQDLQDKPQDGLQDGTAHVGMVMVSKKW